MGVLERRGARRPRGTFAEALLSVPPSGADPPAAAPGRHGQVALRSAQVGDDLALRLFGSPSLYGVAEVAPGGFGGESSYDGGVGLQGDLLTRGVVRLGRDIMGYH